MIKRTFWIICLLLLASCSEKKSHNLVENAGFETLDDSGKAASWLISRHAGKLAYKFNVDKNKAFEGESSFKIEQYKKQGYGIVKQQINLPDNDKTKIRFSAKLLTEDIVPGKGVQLVVNFKAKDGYIIKQVKSDSLTGSNEWIELALQENIPERTSMLLAGIMLQSVGIIWIDDVRLKLE